jgi:hypothetical protein
MLLSFHFGNRDNLSVLVLDAVRLLAGRRVLPLGVAGKCNQTAGGGARGIPETGEMHDGHTYLANGTLSNSTALKAAGKSVQLSWGQ